MYIIAMGLLILKLTLMLAALSVHGRSQVQLPGWQISPVGQQGEANALAENMAIYRDTLVRMSRKVRLPPNGQAVDAQALAAEFPPGYAPARPWRHVVQRPNIIVFSDTPVSPDISLEIARLDSSGLQEDIGSGMAGVLTRDGAGLARIQSPTFRVPTFTLAGIPAATPAGAPVWLTVIPIDLP